MATRKELEDRMAEVQAQLAAHGLDEPAGAPPKLVAVRCDHCKASVMVPEDYALLVCPDTPEAHADYGTRPGQHSYGDSDRTMHPVDNL